MDGFASFRQENERAFERKLRAARNRRVYIYIREPTRDYRGETVRWRLNGGRGKKIRVSYVWKLFFSEGLSAGMFRGRLKVFPLSLSFRIIYVFECKIKKDIRFKKKKAIYILLWKKKTRVSGNKKPIEATPTVSRDINSKNISFVEELSYTAASAGISHSLKNSRLLHNTHGVIKKFTRTDESHTYISLFEIPFRNIHPTYITRQTFAVYIYIYIQPQTKVEMEKLKKKRSEGLNSRV